MSSKRNSEEKTPRGSLSRRGFMRGVGVGSGALGSGVLLSEAEAQSAAAVAGPGAVPITFTSTENRQPHRRTARHAARRPAQSPRPDRRQARLRPRHLRRLHRHHQRQGRLRLHRPGHRRPGQEDRDHRGPLRAGQACTRYRRRSSRTTPSSAATARPASSWPPRVSSTSIPTPPSKRWRRASAAISAAAAPTWACARPCWKPPRTDEGRTTMPDYSWPPMDERKVIGKPHQAPATDSQKSPAGPSTPPT